MKFMAHWKIDQDKWLPVLKKWTSMTPQERGNAGEGVRIVGRWHDVAARTGVLILESDALADVQRYIGTWNPYMDIAVVPVLDDEESAAVCQKILEDNKV